MKRLWLILWWAANTFLLVGAFSELHRQTRDPAYAKLDAFILLGVVLVLWWMWIAACRLAYHGGPDPLFSKLPSMFAIIGVLVFVGLVFRGIMKLWINH